MSAAERNLGGDVDPIPNSVIIIGAGIAGLSAGCYLQMNGYQTHIFELHTLPGGLCTSWHRHTRGAPGARDDYTFDGCIHWLAGSGPGSAFYPMWCELLDMPAIPFVNHDLRFAIEVDQPDPHGSHTFYLYSDVQRLERYLKEISPQDARAIDELIGSIRTLQKYDLPPLWDVAPELRTWRDNLKLLKYLPFLLHARKWSKISNFQFADRLHSPFLRAGFRRLFMDSELSMLIMTLQLAWYDQKCAGYPIGGSLHFAQRIAERYESLGGTLHYRAPVRRILVEKGRAVGIELENGQQHRAGLVVSAADGHWTIYEALEGRYVDSSVRDLYAGKTLPTFESLVMVSLGVARTFETEPYLLRFPLAEPMTIADGTCFDAMEAHIYNYDPTLAPAGSTVLSVMLYTRNHTYWTELRARDRKAYQAAKDAVARQVVERLEARFGNIKDKVELIDVATPATFIRFTRNWHGCYEGWYVSNNPLGVHSLSKTLPGLDRFYMVGQWVEPGGGLPIVAQSGRNLAQIICKRDNKRFVTTRPSGSTARRPLPAGRAKPQVAV